MFLLMNSSFQIPIIIIIIFGCIVQLAGSQLPDQGLKLSHGRKLQILTLDHQGTPSHAYFNYF